MIGRYWQLDRQGYILNDADPALITPEFAPVVDAAVSVYRRRLGPHLHSIYVRGSVPRGLALPGVSDLDTFALTAATPDAADEEWFEYEEAKLLSRANSVHTEPFDGVRPAGIQGAERSAMRCIGQASQRRRSAWSGPPEAGFSRPLSFVAARLRSARPRREPRLVSRRQKTGQTIQYERNLL